MQRNKKTFKGQNIYIGIDVHKPKGRFFWLPLAKYIKHPILLQTKRTVPLVCYVRNYTIFLECCFIIDKFA